jgi:hypothetical protein
MSFGELPHITTTNVVKNGKKLRESYRARATCQRAGQASEIAGKFGVPGAYDLSPEALPELLPGWGMAMAW